MITGVLFVFIRNVMHRLLNYFHVLKYYFCLVLHIVAVILEHSDIISEVSMHRFWCL